MTDINSVGSALNAYDIDKKTQTAAKSNELGKDEFLQLMIAQLNNQNPLEPQGNGEFIAQLAQFSTVEGVQNMSSGFEDLATSYKSSQALQASALVGGAVTIDGRTNTQLRFGELVFGMAEIEGGSDQLRLQIENSSGQMIEDIELGYQNSGAMTFKWDGANLEVNGKLMDIDYSKFQTDEDGNIIPHQEGDYSFRVLGNVLGQQQAMAVSMSERVDSVTILPGNDIQLNLAGGKTATMADVKQINAVY